MPRTQPILAIQKLNGKRYIRYGKKKWIITDTQTRSEKILKRLEKLIKLLLKQKTNTKLKGLNRVGKRQLIQEQPTIKGGFVSSRELEKNILRSMPNLLIASNQKPPNPPELPATRKEAPTEPAELRVERIEQALVNVVQEGQKLKEKINKQENETKIVELNMSNKKLYSTYGELLETMGVRPVNKSVSPNKAIIEEIMKNHPEIAGILFNPKLTSAQRKQMLKSLRDTDLKYLSTPESDSEWPGATLDGVNEQDEQEGEGEKGGKEGLSNEDIIKLIKKKPISGFMGVFSLDTIPKEAPENFCFIVNTEKFPVAGHWVSVKGDKNTLEYFDPFGKKPSDAMHKALKKLVHQRGLVQFKINKIKKQRIDSKRCGWHAIKFLQDRNKGKSFSESTGFNAKKLQAINRSEEAVKRLEKRYKNFLSV